MTEQFRNDTLRYFGLSHAIVQSQNDAMPDTWTHSAKIPKYGEGLGDKGFDNTERYFAWFNQVRTPRVLRSRNVKQHEVEEFIEKSICFTGRSIIKACYSFLENVDVLKDTVPRKNMHSLNYAIEWGHGTMNLKNPLRNQDLIMVYLLRIGMNDAG